MGFFGASRGGFLFSGAAGPLAVPGCLRFASFQCGPRKELPRFQKLPQDSGDFLVPFAVGMDLFAEHFLNIFIFEAFVGLQKW